MPYTLTYILVADNTTNGTLGTINVNTGLVQFVPDADYAGTAGSFTYKVNNGFLDSNIATVNVIVSPVNDPPIITSTPPSSTYNVGDNYSYTPITATDVDHNVTELTWSVASLPNWLTLTQVNGTASLSGTVPAGSVTFDIKVSDPLGLFDTQSISIGGIVPDVNSYFKFWFDNSGSMNTTLSRLQRDLLGTGVTNPYADGTCLISYLQDFYATGATEAQGNTNTATNGYDEYVVKVSLVSNPAEQPFRFLNNETLGFSTADPGGNFPSASSVVIGVWMDEASVVGIGAQGETTNSWNPTTSSPVTTNGMTNLTNLRSQITTLNSTDPNFYRGILYTVNTNQASTPLVSTLQSAWTDAVTNATGTQFATNGLQSVSSNLSGANGAIINDGDTNDGYYTEIVIDSLIALGYSIAPYTP
tara:strand:- start:975 stop:2225 length:1251 start_codon:yes stop_codon:yes gene_type:complete